MGIVRSGFHPSVPENLMLLCGTCHIRYDQEYPGFVVLPDNVAQFIQHERDDYKARERAAALGIAQPRTLPAVCSLNTTNQMEANSRVIYSIYSALTA